MTGAARAAEVRHAINAAVAALADTTTVIHALPSNELAAFLTDIDRMTALGQAARVQITAEADHRGDIAASQSASAGAWIREHAVSLPAGEAYAVARCAGLLHRRDLHGLPDAIRQADVTPTLAVGIAKNFDSISDLLLPGVHDTIIEAMITAATHGGPTAIRDLRNHLLATHGHDDALDHDQDSRKKLLDLSAGTEINGTYHYTLILDAEAHAVLEAGIGPLSAPHPHHDRAAEPDLRPTGRRRAEALIELCRRATAAGAEIPSTTKAQLLVTITLDDLTSGTGAGVVLGSRNAGALLAPGTIRKLACDAGIIPVILGTHSEILDVGHRHRLFQPAQLKALWLRDRHCTFPDCSTPAHWADAHHLIHWIDGGKTDLDNAALLCARHHTIAHRDQLAGTITNNHVTWDRRPNSYQHRRSAA